MKSILKIASYIGLILTILPCCLVFGGVITLQTNNYLMFFGTIVWFVTAPFWMNSSQKATSQQT